MPNLKLPPQNLEAEQSVLGSVLIDEEAIFKVAETLIPEHFYNPAHKIIFGGILELYVQRKPIDSLTLTDILTKQKKLKAIGGNKYLSQLVANVPTAAHVEEYAKIIQEASVRRRMITFSVKLDEFAYMENKELEELLDNAEQELLSIAEASSSEGFVHVSQLLEAVYDRAEELNKDKDALRGVPTGFPYVDNILGGLQKSDLVILAARPSVGKSTFAFDITRQAAIREKKSVAMFSLEMSNTQVMDRLLSMVSGIGLWDLRMGKIKDESFSKLSDAMGILSETNIFIDDTPGITIMDMRTKARKLKVEKGIDLIVVDYLQLITGRKSESRVQEVSEISRLLKGLARELDVPVLALAQLSRAVEQRGGDGTPQLSDLRDSGSIEQDADVVIFLNKIIDDDDADNMNRMLTIAKHRNGPTGAVELFFVKELASFREIDKTH